MKNSRLLILLAGFLGGSTFADWTVEKREPLPSTVGLNAEKIRIVSNGGTPARTTLHVVRFSPKEFTFAVMDDPDKAFDLATASEKRGAIASVNGGYFHPDRTPLGLVVRQGTEIHGLEKAKLLSGFLVVTDRKISLVRAGNLPKPRAIREALQAGPFLVEEGKAVHGLNADRAAARTFIFERQDGEFGFGVCGPVSLAAMGQILATEGIVGDGKVPRALNLDGGSSTGLWIAAEKPFYLREGRDVRNFLGVVPR